MNLNLTSNTNVNKISTCSFDSVLHEFRNVFNESLGTFKGPPVSIKIHENCSPNFLNARNAPFALRSKVTSEIGKIVKK